MILLSDDEVMSDWQLIIVNDDENWYLLLLLWDELWVIIRSDGDEKLFHYLFIEIVPIDCDLAIEEERRKLSVLWRKIGIEIDPLVEEREANETIGGSDESIIIVVDSDDDDDDINYWLLLMLLLYWWWWWWWILLNNDSDMTGNQFNNEPEQ